MDVSYMRSRKFATNSLFPAFTVGIIGWGLLHAWGSSVKIGVLFHGLAALSGSCLSSLILYRYRKHWPIAPMSPGADNKRYRVYLKIPFCLILAAAGVGIWLIIRDGHFFSILAAACMVFVPWTKIAMSRDHFFLASVLIAGGALFGLIVLDGPKYPMHYPIAALLLFALAFTLLVLVIVTHGNRSERMQFSEN